jgi:SAM-dependent methyltransferase
MTYLELKNGPPTCPNQTPLGKKMNRNAIAFRPVNHLKRILMPTGRHPRKVLFGPFRGLVLNLDFQTQSQLYWGLYEKELNYYIRLALSKSHWIIDIGAGAGELSLLFAKNGKEFFAIEASADEIQNINFNAMLNSIIAPPERLICKFAGEINSTEMVRADSLDVDRSTAGLIKIDVEGSELNVLEGATKLISECKSLFMVIETHSELLEIECLTVLRRKGFECTIVNNAWWRFLIPEHRSQQHNRWIWAVKGAVV